MKTMTDIATSTSTLCMRRRIMKTVIARMLRHRGAAVPPPHRCALPLGHPKRQRVLVGVGLVDQSLLRGPGGYLVVERDDAEIVDADLGRFLQQLLARGVVDRVQRLRELLVQLRIGVAATVGRTPA